MEKIGTIEFVSKAASISVSRDWEALPLASRKRLAQASTRAHNDYVNSEVARQVADDPALKPADVAKAASNAWFTRLDTGDWNTRAGAASLSPFETQRRIILVDQLVKSKLMGKADAEKAAKSFDDATRTLGEAIAKATDRGDVETVVDRIRKAIDERAKAAVEALESPLF